MTAIAPITINEPIDEALALAERGIPVFPVRLTAPDANGKRKKTPATEHGHLDATTDSGTIDEWWRRNPNAAVGVPTGEASGLMALDVDPAGETWATENAEILMAAGRIHYTERGRHYLYQHIDGVRNSSGTIAPGVDIRGEGGWIVWWPARGLESHGELEEVGPAPESLAAQITASLAAQITASQAAQEPQGTAPAVANVIPDGKRNEYLSREAYRLRRQGASIEQIHNILAAMNEARCKPPLPDSEVRKVAEGKAGIEAEDGGTWPIPTPLSATQPPPLPIEQWPAILRDYAKGAAAETETPVELPAMLALGTLAAAVQRIADVEIKPGYSEPLCIFTAVILPPATRKSREFKRATKPLAQWESEQKKAVEKEAERAQSRRKTEDDRIRELRKTAAKEKDENKAGELAEEIADAEVNRTEIPTPPRRWTSDVTTEELARLMDNNEECGAAMSAEGGIFDTMAGRYTNGVANLDIYLQGHAGDPCRSDRVGKPPIILDDPRLTMALAVQPDVVAALQAKPGFRGRGLLGRFLYALPETNLGRRTGGGQRIDSMVEQSYIQTTRTLLDMGDGEPERMTLNLTSGALSAWQEFAAEVEIELADGGRFEHCRDWAGKLPGAVARIAALFHAVSVNQSLESDRTVGADEINAAIQTGRVLAEHALATFDLMGADESVEGARILLRWIRRHGLHEFRARDAQHNHGSRFPRIDDLRPALEVLEERGYIRAVEQPPGAKGGRPTTVYEVNPEALQ